MSSIGVTRAEVTRRVSHTRLPLLVGLTALLTIIAAFLTVGTPHLGGVAMEPSTWSDSAVLGDLGNRYVLVFLGVITLALSFVGYRKKQIGLLAAAAAVGLVLGIYALTAVFTLSTPDIPGLEVVMGPGAVLVAVAGGLAVLLSVIMLVRQTRKL